jgi:hypothetical protein
MVEGSFDRWLEGKKRRAFREGPKYWCRFREGRYASRTTAVVRSGGMVVMRTPGSGELTDVGVEMAVTLFGPLAFLRQAEPAAIDV